MPVSPPLLQVTLWGRSKVVGDYPLFSGPLDDMRAAMQTRKDRESLWLLYPCGKRELPDGNLLPPTTPSPETPAISPMSQKTHPTSRGWIHGTLTLFDSAPLDVEGMTHIRNQCSGDKPDDYEFAELSQRGRKVKVVYRKKPEVARAEKCALITPTCRRADEMLRACGAMACWHEDDSRYYIEAWRNGEKLGVIWLHYTDLRSLVDCEPDEAEISKQLNDLFQQVKTAGV
jgi:hypothetical protein